MLPFFSFLGDVCVFPLIYYYLSFLTLEVFKMACESLWSIHWLIDWLTDRLLLPSSHRASSSHHSAGKRLGVSWLPRRPHMPRCQHRQLQPHLAERRPRRPCGSESARADQPVASGVLCEPGSVRLVRVHRHEWRRSDVGANLPHRRR